MTEAAALLQFFSQFDIPAYPNTAVPAKAEYPYLTYENTVTSFQEGPVDIAVNLWYRTESEAIPNAKAREIKAYLGENGRLIDFDGGKIWINRGRPWCQSLLDDDDKSIKRRYMIFHIQYLDNGH